MCQHHVTNRRTDVEKHSPTKVIKNIMKNANIQGVQGAVGTQKGLTSQESGVAMVGWEGRSLQRLLRAGTLYAVCGVNGS